MWRCCGRLHVAWLRGRWALTVSPTGVAVRLHGAPTVPRASATPNATGTAGRNSRECPLEPAAP
ncbi:retrotransposon hot spot protein (RHS), putative, partial [Trypanosoma cruzi]